MDKYKLLGNKYFIDKAKSATDRELFKMYKTKENKFAISELRMRGYNL